MRLLLPLLLALATATLASATGANDCAFSADDGTHFDLSGTSPPQQSQPRLSPPPVAFARTPSLSRCASAALACWRPDDAPIAWLHRSAYGALRLISCVLGFWRRRRAYGDRGCARTRDTWI